MKKILVILAVCFVMVSCQWWHETFSSPADCAVWYCEQVTEAEKAGDDEKVEELTADFEAYLESLDEAEAVEACQAATAWAFQNADF